MAEIKQNPYSPRSASPGSSFNPTTFFGREYIMTRIYSGLINQQNISLVGKRYIGKSSLLKYLCLPQTQSKFGYDLSHYVLVMINLKEQLYKNPDDFFYSICKHIASKYLGQFGLDIAYQTSYGPDMFTDILEQIKKQGSHTILLLDDFEQLTRNSIFGLEFFAFLRSQVTSGNVSYVTTTTAPLYSVSHSNIEGSPFFNIFEYIEIKALEQNAVLELIIEPSNAIGYPFSNVEIEWILKFAGRHPFFIQYICSLLIDEKYQHKSLSVDLATFETKIYKELSPYFKSLYSKLDHSQKDQLFKEIEPVDIQKRSFSELSESFLFCKFLYKEHPLEYLLKPLIQDFGTNRNTEFIQNSEKLLSSFCSYVGMSLVGKEVSGFFTAFILNTNNIFDSLHNIASILIFVPIEIDIKDDVLNHMRLLLHSHQIAVLLSFCDVKNLRRVKRDLVRYSRIYAFDIAIINQENLRAIVSTRDPEKSLRHLILSQMNLTLVNPYVIMGPTPLNFFFGREHELREITRRANAVSYILTGGRRIGKTSIMHCLYHERLPAAGFRTIYHECSITSSYEDFLHTKVKTNDGYTITLDELFESLDKYAPLVLLLDEVDKLVPIDRRNNWPLFKHLRKLINSGQLQVVLCGERTLHEALSDGSGPLHNFGPKLSIGMLEKAAVAELITKPMKQLEIELVKENEIVDYIWQVSSGHPNVVQLICDRLIHFLHSSNNRGRRILLDNVIAIAQDPDFQRNGFLNTYWENATLLERIISLLMATLDLPNWTVRNVRHSLEEHLKLIGPDGQVPSAVEVSNALDRLINLRGILQHPSNGYKFAVSAFPLMITSSHMMEDLFEVYGDAYHRHGDLTLEEIQLKETK